MTEQPSDEPMKKTVRFSHEIPELHKLATITSSSINREPFEFSDGQKTAESTERKKKFSSFVTLNKSLKKLSQTQTLYGGIVELEDELNEDARMLKDIKQSHEDNDMVQNLSTMVSLDKY